MNQENTVYMVINIANKTNEELKTEVYNKVDSLFLVRKNELKQYAIKRSSDNDMVELSKLLLEYNKEEYNMLNQFYKQIDEIKKS